ncbi:hypothetical protein PINS_up002648 [Pythium insidiosum]|nr:hypothetical protein PINS_up002648 [Pythium insidiosum]
MAVTGGGDDDDATRSTQDILNDLARSIAAAKRRRMRQQLHAAALQEPSTDVSTPSKRRSLVPGEEDRRNRIPLRRPTLSDQVIYGPTITSGFLKPRKSISQQQQGTSVTANRQAPAAGESSNECVRVPRAVDLM